MKQVTFVVMAVLALAACATKPVRPSEALQVPQDRLIAYQSPITGGGEITVVRDKGMTGGGCYAGIFVGGELAAKVGTGEKASFQLPAGRAVVSAKAVGAGLCGIGAQDRGERSTEIHVESGQHRIYRLALSSAGEVSINPIN
ncbi:hypothetical protein ABNK63_07845 [Rhodanobacter sp. IGA1.0]|uniref:3-isopropylmalate dehydratase n=1 Tax=Rhodanobacter sp. IGA1.0 TaxID=3158582 RepID=A0AAU7QQE0_9GAMM